MRQLQDIANVLRIDSIKATTAAGSGHPTSCMSMAEIMSVLWFNEMKYDVKNADNLDNDEFILSKGHAAPILYASLFRAGCIRNDLTTLRMIDSPLEGHPMPNELKWIKVATGSLGQGLSVGVGYALAAKMQKRKFRTYVVLGDSEIAEGSVYEACQLAAENKLNNLVAIVDVNRLGQRGETMIGHKIKDYEKRFKGFGWDTMSIDGHNVKQVLSALSRARKSKKPVVILAKTFKGKGVSFIENKEGRHGKALTKEEMKKALAEIGNVEMPKIKIKKPNRINLKIKKNKVKIPKYLLGDEVSTRKAYGETLAELAKSDNRVIAVDGEVSNSTYSEEVKKKTPKQFVEAYIAEQNMVGMAQGLSIKGFDVFASTFAAFLSRAHDQIRMAAVGSANINFCGSHAGISIGPDGVSQMGLEDIGIFRALPESFVFYPSDATSCAKLTQQMVGLGGIKYIRTTRENTPVLYKPTEKFVAGDFKVIRKSLKDKVVLVGAGITLHESIKAYAELKKQGINVSVVDLYSVRPFNAKKFISFVKKHGKKDVVTEDHYSAGGIGEMLEEELVNSGIKIKHLAVKGLAHSGKKDEVLKKYKIDFNAIVNSVKKMK